MYYDVWVFQLVAVEYSDGFIVGGVGAQYMGFMSLG